jgi:hypothetical protein
MPRQERVRKRKAKDAERKAKWDAKQQPAPAVR